MTCDLVWCDSIKFFFVDKFLCEQKEQSSVQTWTTGKGLFKLLQNWDSILLSPCSFRQLRFLPLASDRTLKKKPMHRSVFVIFHTSVNKATQKSLVIKLPLILFPCLSLVLVQESGQDFNPKLNKHNWKSLPVGLHWLKDSLKYKKAHSPEEKTLLKTNNSLLNHLLQSWY